MSIKAIETVYKGYKFRSRLEARWAVFFDEIGLEWQYEVEGFEFGGQRYLPDFLIPRYNVWIEIKPKNVALPLDYLNKLKMFSKKSEQKLIIISGDPYRWSFDVMIFPASSATWETGLTSFSFIDFIISDKETFSEATSGNLFISFIKENGDLAGWFIVGKVSKTPATSTEGKEITEQAYLAARQARFEYNSYKT